MRWHHIAFDEEEQAGFGEYTLRVLGELTLHSITARSPTRRMNVRPDNGFAQTVRRCRIKTVLTRDA
jgi:hypothetical protein